MKPAEQTDGDVAVADLVSLLNKQGLVQLLDVFLNKGRVPVTQEDLEGFTGVDRGTVSRNVEELCELGIVERSEEGSPWLYRLDTDHPAANSLREAQRELYAHVDEIQASSEEYDPDSDHAHEGSPFVELFRYPTNVKILAGLLINPEQALNAAELAREADVNRSTVGDNIGILCRIGLVTEVNESWMSHPRFILNQSHPATEPFQSALDALTPNQLPQSGAEAAAAISQRLRTLLEGIDLEQAKRDQYREDWAETYQLQQLAEQLSENTEADKGDTGSDPPSECTDQSSVRESKDDHEHWCRRVGPNSRTMCAA